MEGKPRMEGYAAGWPATGGEPAMAALEAAGDAVAAGLGRVMVQVACLFAAAAGAETLAGMEQAAVEASREIGLGALQRALDARARPGRPRNGRAAGGGGSGGGRSRPKSRWPRPVPCPAPSLRTARPAPRSRSWAARPGSRPAPRGR